MPECACAAIRRAFGWRRSRASTSHCGTLRDGPQAVRSTVSSAARFAIPYASTPPAFATAASNALSGAFEAAVAKALAFRKRGFDAIKIALGRDIEGDRRTVRALREALGDEVMLHADAAGSYDRYQAIEVGHMLQDHGVTFFEMPIPPEDVDGYAMLSRRLSIPLALDSLMTRHETLRFLELGALHLVQPDVCRAGGITECRRIAELADARGAAFAPHVSIGSVISFAASAHLASAMPNTMTCEYWAGENPLGDAVLEEPLQFSEGRLRAPDAPGLGIAVRADRLLADGFAA